MKFPFWRERRKAELSDEIQSHVEMAVRDRIDRGQDPIRARELARRELGNEALIREATGDQRGFC